MRKVLFIVLIGLGIYSSLDSEPVAPASTVVETQEIIPERIEASVVSSSGNIYGSAHSGSQIQGSGKVIRILSDDNDGSRHQRFIIRLQSGQTLLVTHNIDLAARIGALSIDGEFNSVVNMNGIPKVV